MRHDHRRRQGLWRSDAAATLQNRHLDLRAQQRDSVAMRARNNAEELCRCGHTLQAHTHYRRGLDCALCPDLGCPRFRSVRLRTRSWLNRLLGRGWF